MKSLLTVVALFLLVATGHTQEPIVNPYATSWANVGVDIPNRTTICATVDAQTYSYGEFSAAEGIQAALNACPVGQVVQLSEGRFTVNDHLKVPSYVTLRGKGPGSTVLQKTNFGENEHIVLLGSNQFGHADNATAVNLTADGVAGAMSVTIADATGFTPGQFVKIDADEWTTAGWRPDSPLKDGTQMEVWGTDRVTYKIRRPELSGNIGEGSLDDYSRYGRVIAEIKEIAAVDGNVITFTSPLHIAYPVSKVSQLVRYTGLSVHTKWSGVEDLTLTGGTAGNLKMTTTAHSWAKNIECTQFGNPCVDITEAFRVELRDSYIHHANNPVPGGGGYALSMRSGASEVLIENNIVMWANKVMVSRASGAGSVVGYNYMQDSLIRYNMGFMEVGINASHYPAPHHVLFEGNQSSNYDSDATFGGSIYMTVFRNWLEGERRSYPHQTATPLGRAARAIGSAQWSWWHFFAGNVLGRPTLDPARWVFDDPCDGTATAGNSACNPKGAMWRIGYASSQFQLSDPITRSTAIREGNFDYLTNTVNWSGTPKALPNSMYLTSKPAFFGNLPWPWVTPEGTVKTHTLPAKLRLECILNTPDCLSNGDAGLRAELDAAIAARDAALETLAAERTATAGLLAKLRQALADLLSLIP